MSGVGYRNCNPTVPPGTTSDRVTEIPGGPINCVNIDFTTSQEFVPGTLEVYLGGRRLTPGLDFIEGGDNQSFQLLIDPSDHRRLNSAPDGSEDLLVSYVPA